MIGLDIVVKPRYLIDEETWYFIHEKIYISLKCTPAKFNQFRNIICWFIQTYEK